MSSRHAACPLEVSMFIVRSEINPKLILCTNGEWCPESQVGPGGWSAKVYKTRKGAERVRGGHVVVEEMK